MPQPIHVRLEKYAAAASVASLASVGAADVIYRQVDQFVAADHYFNINVVTGAIDSGQGFTTMTSHNLGFEFISGESMAIFAVRAHSGIDPNTTNVWCAAALNFGDAVNPVAYPYAILRYYDSYGTWEFDEVKFLGFSVADEDGNAVDGWAQLELTAAGIHIIDYAYDNTGAAITAGQGLPAGAAVPGAGGLAALACGAAGFRRRRTRVTTA
jgi:hypothetical protein